MLFLLLVEKIFYRLNLMTFNPIFLQYSLSFSCASLNLTGSALNSSVIFFLFSYNCLHFLPITSTPPQPVPPPSPTSTLPLDFFLVSFIVAPENPSPH